MKANTNDTSQVFIEVFHQTPLLVTSVVKAAMLYIGIRDCLLTQVCISERCHILMSVQILDVKG